MGNKCQKPHDVPHGLKATVKSKILLTMIK
jgi:hypothetical protein